MFSSSLQMRHLTFCTTCLLARLSLEIIILRETNHKKTWTLRGIFNFHITRKKTCFTPLKFTTAYARKEEESRFVLGLAPSRPYRRHPGHLLFWSFGSARLLNPKPCPGPLTNLSISNFHVPLLSPTTSLRLRDRLRPLLSCVVPAHKYALHCVPCKSSIPWFPSSPTERLP
jgi:hypothetical protein